MVPMSGEQPLSLEGVRRARKRTEVVEAWLDSTTASSDPDLDYALVALQADEVALGSEKSGLISLAAVSLALAAIFVTLYQQQQALPYEQWSELGIAYGWLFIASLATTVLCMFGMLYGSWRGRGRQTTILRLLKRRRDNATARAEAAAEAAAEQKRLMAESPARAWRFVRVRGHTRQGQVYLASER